MGFAETLAELDERDDLTTEQAKKLAQIRDLAAQRGLIDPTKLPNPRNEAISQAPAPTRTFADSATDFLSRDVPEIGAATAGGMAGARQAARIPAPPMLKPLIVAGGSVAGATAGLMSARAPRQMYDQGAPLTLDQLIDQAKQAGLEAGAGEATGAGLRLMGKGYQLGKQSILAGRTTLPEELQTFENAKNMGVHLTPADVTLQPSALRTEQTLRGTQAGADIFKKRGQLNQENFQRAYEHDLLDTVASKVTPEERGQLIKDVLEGRAIPEYQEMARRGFDELRNMTDGAKTVMPKESLALAQELANSVTAETNPKAAGIIKKVLEQISQPGLVTGMKVARRTETTPATPGTERMTGLNVRTNSELERAPLSTGLTVRSKYGDVSSENQAIEDLGGKKAEAPLIGLNIRKKSDAPQAPLVTGLKVSPQYEKTPDTPGKDYLAGLEVSTTSHAPNIPRPLDFMEAHDVRSMLGELGSTGETLPKKASGIANKLWQVLGLEMEQGAIKFQQDTGIPLAKKWRQADALVKEEGHALFDDNVISKMIRARPEDVVKETLKKDGITEMRRAVTALERIHDEPGLEQLRRGILEEMWQRGIQKHGMKRGEFSGASFADAAEDVGHDVLKIGLGPIYPRYRKFLDVAARMDPKTSSGVGMSLVDKGMMVTAPLAGVGGSIMSGSAYPLVAASAGLGAWLIGTKRLSNMLNDPQQAGRLLRVMNAKPSTEAWTRGLGQLVSTESAKAMRPE